MKRRNEVLVGILTIISLAVGIVGTVWLSRGSLRKGYVLYAVFPWGSGLRQGQPVALAGVNVGYVDDVILRDNGTLLVTMRVHKAYKVPIETKAAVQPVGFFGDAQIALLPKGPNAVSITEGDTIPSAPPGPTIPDELMRVDTIGRSIAAITHALNAELVQAGGIKDLRTAMANLTKLTSKLTEIAATQSEQLTLTQATLRRAVSSIDSLKVDSTLNSLRSVSANLASATSELKDRMADIKTVMAKVQSGDGSLAKLLNDPTVYNNLVSATARITAILEDFQNNPRKYLNLKFSVF